MKRNLRRPVIVLIIIAAAIWIYCDVTGDPSPLYIPGRDTLKEWNDGECEIVGRTSSGNILKFLREDISRIDSFVNAYKQVDQQIFFIMTKGDRIVVDLEAAAYETYENAESVDGKYRAVFDDCESFTWLPTDEGGTR